MRFIARSPSKALTLIELLIFVAIWAALAAAVMRSLGDGRMLRSRAHHRGVMTLIAQEEIERARMIPAAQLREGVAERVEPFWPRDVHSTTRLEMRADGTWLVDVEVQRESAQGYSPVRMATIRTGSGPASGQTPPAPDSPAIIPDAEQAP